MKKTILSALATVMLAVILVGCAHQSDTTIDDAKIVATTTTTPSDVGAPEESIKQFDFPKIPSDEEILDHYRQEVRKRLEILSEEEDGIDFFTDDEAKFFQLNGYHRRNEQCYSYYDTLYDEIDVYLWPILYQGENGIEMLYVSRNGDLAMRSTSNRHVEYFENVHHTGNEREEIKHDCSYTIVYNEAEGRVSAWVLGQEERVHFVPKGSVYTGMSTWAGYLFRSETDVYAVQEMGMSGRCEFKANPIAHGVSEVILADYYYGSDEWSNPLFLMLDGTLKVYSSWHGDSDAALDDESHLIPIQVEGGYGK